MLILSRKLNESIVIDGRITVKVLRVDGEVVKLGISAPADIPVHRLEVYEEIRRSNEAAATRAWVRCPDSPPDSAARQPRSHSNRWQEDRRPNPDMEVTTPD